jgi:hypothetical protein
MGAIELRCRSRLSRLLCDLFEPDHIRRHSPTYRALERTMKHKQRWRNNSSLTARVFVGGFMGFLGGLMIAAAWARLVCVPLPPRVEALLQFAISGSLLSRIEAGAAVAPVEVSICLMTIGVGQLITGLMQMAPFTAQAGALLASSFWGVAIGLHLAHGESFQFQFVLLVLSWLAGISRAIVRHADFISSIESVRPPCE